MTEKTICGTCTHWQFQAIRDMGKEGFGCCALGPRWEWLPPAHTCKKHKQAHPQVLVARRADYAKR
jgi:hypothetical protein